MKPPITYYGGKTRLADWIVSLLSPHRVYVEPFFGSGAVLFAKPRAQHEIANDVDGNVTHFFRILRERTDDLELACRLTPYSREERATCLDLDVDDDLERARRWWVLVQQSYGHKLRGTGWATSIKQGNNRAMSTWRSIDRFAAAAVRLTGVTIENRDALEVIEHYDAPDAVQLLDPPYLEEVRTGLNLGQRPAGDYGHEFQHEHHHRALAKVVHQCESHVLICGYPGALYEELFSDWYTCSREVVRSSANGRRGTSQFPTSTEMVWSNRPIDEGRLFEVAR